MRRAEHARAAVRRVETAHAGHASGMRSMDELLDDPEKPGESGHKRLDRNLIELLQELRVAQAGVQILFAFLLTLPFTQRFGSVTAFQRTVYLVTLLLSAGAAVCLIAPASFHRLVFRRHDKRALIFVANRFAIAGLALLALAMTGAILLVTDVLFKRGTVIVVTGAIALGFLICWYVIPLRYRLHDDAGETGGAGDARESEDDGADDAR